MERREATGVIDRKNDEVKRAGKERLEMMRAWVDARASLRSFDVCRVGAHETLRIGAAEQD